LRDNESVVENLVVGDGIMNVFFGRAYMHPLGKTCWGKCLELGISDST